MTGKCILSAAMVYKLLTEGKTIIIVNDYSLDGRYNRFIISNCQRWFREIKSNPYRIKITEVEL